jgi:hypothetical protein
MMLYVQIFSLFIPLAETILQLAPQLYHHLTAAGRRCKACILPNTPLSIPRVSLTIGELHHCLPDFASLALDTGADIAHPQVQKAWYIGSYLKAFYTVVPSAEVL